MQCIHFVNRGKCTAKRHCSQAVTDVFPQLKHWVTSSKEQGMIVFTRAPLLFELTRLYRIWKMWLFLIKSKKNYVYCDYWMGGAFFNV